MLVRLGNKLKNYNLKDKEGFLYCLFEGISNALYGCKNNNKIKIQVTITRDYPINDVMGNKSKNNPIKSLIIEDNGIGFTDINFNNFAKEIENSNYGGKGLGRLAYLKVFNSVKIESYYDKYYREFEFKDNIEDTKQEKNGNGTKVIFNEIKSNYKEKTKNDTDFYYEELLKHFYVYLYYLKQKNIKFEIVINDNDEKKDVKIINNELLDKDEVENNTFKLKEFETEYEFKVLHIKTENIATNNSFYVVDERSIGDNIAVLPPTKLTDKNNKEFFYYVFLQSDYFNKFLNETRTELILPTEEEDNLICERQIIEKLQEKIDNYLSYELAKLNEIREAEIKKVLEKRENNKVFNNNAYLPIIFENENTKKEFLSKIKYKLKDKDIIEQARIFTNELKERTIENINKALKKNDININEIERLTKQVNLHNSVELSSYIMYRKYILEFFNKNLEKYKNNKEQNEALFHNLFFKKNSNNTKNSNMWLIDDSFLYFEGISEIELQDITINNKKIIRENLTNDELEKINEFNKNRAEQRIDLLFFPNECKCVIIELKDPKINELNVTQLDKYTKFIANFVKKEFEIQSFYTYLITDSFNEFDVPNGFKKIYNTNGYFRPFITIPNTQADQYTEIISYTDIYKRALSRNNIFFEKLNCKQN